MLVRPQVKLFIGVIQIHGTAAEEFVTQNTVSESTLVMDPSLRQILETGRHLSETNVAHIDKPHPANEALDVSAEAYAQAAPDAGRGKMQGRMGIGVDQKGYPGTGIDQQRDLH